MIIEKQNSAYSRLSFFSFGKKNVCRFHRAAGGARLHTGQKDVYRDGRAERCMKADELCAVRQGV